MEARVEMAVAPEDVSFTAEYKRRILKEADACTTPGAIGALLRREGLYSSHLVEWPRARARGELAALTPKTRGRKPTPVDPGDAADPRMSSQSSQRTPVGAGR